MPVLGLIPSHLCETETSWRGGVRLSVADLGQDWKQRGLAEDGTTVQWKPELRSHDT